jgi:SNF2 family DNA or RNA helicase
VLDESNERGEKTTVPANIAGRLRDYQIDGVQFMYRHVRRGHGCILGDDMGMGKTIQTIALLAALLDVGSMCLVVVY